MLLYVCDSSIPCHFKIAVAANVIAKQEHKLQGSLLQVNYADHNQEEMTTYLLDDTLEVSNLPHDVSEDLLALYFESPKSGGCADTVKSVTILRPGVARIQFSSTKGEPVEWNYC